MAKRKESDKLAWNWLNINHEINSDNIASAYRLICKQHKPFTCRKNCRNNPNCLSGFGEFNWAHPVTVANELLDDQRSKETFVGLKNLGNTCYISSLLQLWFHNVAFREAVYLWNALESQIEIAKQLDQFGQIPSDSEQFQPLSDVTHLQLLFAEMEFGLRKASDPSDFCKSLSIDVELQQDAQEFNKLYMQRLERTFASASNERTQNVVQNQFRGKYAYVTTCAQCKNESVRDSYFYELELNVKGFKTINDSLADFIREEPLVGDNKYYCSVCGSKQEGATCIRLQCVPPILQLQLLRYAFDVTTATRKKISQAIQFPDVLDMSPYLHQPPKTFLFSLHAVLMHSGNSANSGHYYAHIKTDNGWHIFDDVTVKKQKSLALLNEESSTSTKSGYRSSSSSYMLVYSKLEPHQWNAEQVVKQPSPQSESPSSETNDNILKNNDKDKSNSNVKQFKNFIKSQMLEKTSNEMYVNRWHLLPDYAKSHIKRFNVKFLDMCEEEAMELEMKIDHYEFLQNFIPNIVPAVISEETCAFLHYDALRNLTKAYRVKPYEPIPIVDNSGLLCQHNLLDLEKFKDYKVVSRQAFNILLEKFGGGPLIKYSDLCSDCVRRKAEAIKTHNMLMNDYRATQQFEKEKEAQRGFWVVKNSFKDWWKLVMSKEPVSGEIEGAVEGNTVDEAAHVPEKFIFNSELICPHGNLTSNENVRKLVSEVCWKILQKYFPNCVEFKDQDMCEICTENANASKLRELQLREDALLEKNILLTLFNDKRDSSSAHNGGKHFLINAEFLVAWKKYIRSASNQSFKEKPPAEGMIEPLICSKHSLLLYDPNVELDRFAVITEDEWTELKKIYTTCLEISVVKNSNIISTVPEVCASCSKERLTQISQLDLEKSYHNANIYVYKVSNEIEEDEDAASAEEISIKKPPLGTRKRKQDDSWESKQAPKKVLLVHEENLRRSSRPRTKPRNQNMFRIDKDTTLKNLKVMIFKKMEVMPSDQRLFLGDVDLEERQRQLGLTASEATLIKLNVLPESTLKLVADEANPDKLEVETYLVPETGFKGTELGR